MNKYATYSGKPAQAQFSKNRQLHVANDLAQPIYALPAPSMGSAIAQLFVDTAKMGASARHDLVPSPSGALKTLEDIRGLVNLLELGRLAARASSDLVDPGSMTGHRRALGDYLKANATLVRPGEAPQLLQVDLWKAGDLFKIQSWQALFNASAITLFLATEDLERFVFFDTGADDSWIFRHGGVVRAKYGSLWQPDPSAGTIYVSRGDRLPSGTWLEPGDSLTSANGQYVFVYQTDGNAVVYDISDRARHKPIWASDTGGAQAWRLELESAGRVVIRSAEGREAWADPRSKTDQATRYWASSLIMGNNGVLQVIGANGGWGWASNWKP
jgi:hypothetical protein